MALSLGKCIDTTSYGVKSHFGTDSAQPLLLTSPTARPTGCLCPKENYTCTVNHAKGLAWRTNTTDRDDLEHSETKLETTRYFDQGGFQVTIIREQDNFSSTLRVTDIRFKQH